MKAAVLFLIVVAAVLFWRFYYAWPAMPPLPTDENDPDITEARRKARDTIDDLHRLYPDNRERGMIKVRFTSNSDQVEYLWGEIKSLDRDTAEVFLITPPVTHSGKLDRHMQVSVNELEDWQVTDEQGYIYGGYTQRAMFKIAREKWGKLPRKLEKIEKLYK